MISSRMGARGEKSQVKRGVVSNMNCRKGNQSGRVNDREKAHDSF